MQESRLREILGHMSNVRIGVIGDFCIDAYWRFDENEVELSVETGKPTHAIAKQYYSLGGAGNVAKNLADLGVGQVWAFCVTGPDVFGQAMLNLMRTNGVRTDDAVVQERDWDTNVYAKPHVGPEEQERIDFGRFNRIASATVDRLLANLEKRLPELDGLIVNQQLARGLHSEAMIERLGGLLKRFGEKVILLDARDVLGRYDGVILKINAGEAARLCGQPIEIQDRLPMDTLVDFARQIHSRTNREVIITQSERGIVAFDGKEVSQVPGILILGEIDPCGAGDTTAAAVTGALAAGTTLREAIELGNMAAAVVCQKLMTTGTASPEEITALVRDCDHVYRVELAEDVRRSRYWEDSEIEVANPQVELGQIRHAIFDHDGTISTLRQGWEQIMEPVMVRSILGPQYLEAPEELYHRVLEQVRDYIDQSTGIETIVQMETLVEMVRKFGLVPADQVLDAMGYKAIYNQALLDMVNARLAKLERGELDPGDYTIKGAVCFLRALAGRGGKLYLASGTDHDNVVHEAGTLGYADLFEGRIYGWAGQGTGSAKKMVIERIIREHNLKGAQLACIGDGPVELRLCKRVDGVAVGVASDEVRRYGLSAVKRNRLIKAGADLLTGDFSQYARLEALLFEQHTIGADRLRLAE